MTGDERQSYIALINELQRAARDMNMLLNNIKRYEMSISRGLVVNDNVTFDNNLNSLKETLNYKINQIKNEIIPNLINMLNRV